MSRSLRYVILIIHETLSFAFVPTSLAVQHIEKISCLQRNTAKQSLYLIVSPCISIWYAKENKIN